VDLLAVTFSAVAGAGAIWASAEARRSANAARRANDASALLVAIEKERRGDEQKAFDDAARLRRAIVDVTLYLPEKDVLSDIGGIALVEVHNTGAHTAAGLRVRASLSSNGKPFASEQRWPFLTPKRETVDDMELDPDRSIGLTVFDMGNAPGMPDTYDRRIECEVLYRDGDGPHRLSATFSYGRRADDWVQLSGEVTPPRPVGS
jgi:hypothetical protein